MPEFHVRAILAYPRMLKSLLFKKLMVTVLAVSLGTMLLGSRPKPQTIDPTFAEANIGRGFIGDVVEVGDDFIAILVRNVEVRVQIDGDTTIKALTDASSGDISLDPPTRTAVLADQAPTGEPVTAIKISVIPSKATREHIRVIATERSGDRLKALDSEGNEFHLGMDAAPVGASLVLIVRPEGPAGLDLKVRAIARASNVDQRLARFAQDLATDSQRNGKIEELLKRREEAQVARFQRTAENSEIVAICASGIGLCPDGSVEIEITGAPACIEITGAPACIEITGSAVKIEFVSPTDGTRVTEGSNINVQLKITEDQLIKVTEDQLIKVTEDQLIKVTEDQLIKVTEDQLIKVTEDQLIKITEDQLIKITEDQLIKITEDQLIKVTEDQLIKITEDQLIENVEINWQSISEETFLANEGEGIWNATTKVPTLPAISADLNYTALPHVFVGPVTIGGNPAPEGTIVTALVDVGGSADRILEATITDDVSGSVTKSITLQVQRAPLQVAQATVADGSVTLLIQQLDGQSFAGKTVMFKFQDYLARETGTWQAGGGDEVSFAFPDP